MLGLNDVQPCGTDARRRTHLAHGVVCPRCEPETEIPARCPMCWESVLLVGGRVRPHEPEGSTATCSGSGLLVLSPPVETPIWVRPPQVRALPTVLRSGGAA